MKKILAIIALISIASLADARVGVGRPGVGVGGVGRGVGVGVGVNRPVARAAVASRYNTNGQYTEGQMQTYPTSSYRGAGHPMARGAMVRGR